MRVRINVEFEISPRQKRVLKVVVPVLVVLAGGVALAGVPTTFNTGDPLSAQSMNDNFSNLDTRLAKVEAVAAKATLDGGFSPNATYCGVSTSTTVGDLSGLAVTGTGYAKARAQCTQTCASPSAHFCTGEELARSAQLGATIPVGWFSTGSYAFDGAKAVVECFGWTNATNGFEGPSWSSSNFPDSNYCNNPLPVLCCD